MKTQRCEWVCLSLSPAGPRQWAYKEQVIAGLVILELLSMVTCPCSFEPMTGHVADHRCLFTKRRERGRDGCPTVPFFLFLLLVLLLPHTSSSFCCLVILVCFYISLELCAGDCCNQGTLPLNSTPSHIPFENMHSVAWRPPTKPHLLKCPASPKWE